MKLYYKFGKVYCSLVKKKTIPEVGFYTCKISHNIPDILTCEMP
jgi:hypothetical protein